MQRSAVNILATQKWTRIASWALGIFLLIMFVIGFWVSREPDIFWVNRSADQESPVVGFSTTDTLMEDADVAIGAPQFFYNNDSWIFPTTESEYQEGIDAFARYRDRLVSGDPDTQFYARADNLREWLAQVEKRLGSLTRRLGNSVAANRINDDLGGDAAAEAAGPQPDTFNVRTSWFMTDNIFFEARGTAWALVHFFRAAEFDFAKVLADKNAEVSVRQIIRELEASLNPLRSPMILNGGGYGLFANHSLVMANYLARANAAVINLRELLDQG
jgi:hypothetical protein